MKDKNEIMRYSWNDTFSNRSFRLEILFEKLPNDVTEAYLWTLLTISPQDAAMRWLNAL